MRNMGNLEMEEFGRFNGMEWDYRRIENEIKCRYWSWCVVKEEADPCISFNDWARN